MESCQKAMQKPYLQVRWTIKRHHSTVNFAYNIAEKRVNVKIKLHRKTILKLNKKN